MNFTQVPVGFEPSSVFGFELSLYHMICLKYETCAKLHRILNRMKSKTGNPKTGAFCKQHFIRVCIVCYDEILREKKICLENYIL